MAGNYQSSVTEHEARIESWMHAVIGDGGIDRYDDLHIHRIDPLWKDQSVWISAGLHVYDLALNIRYREQLPFSVVLGFSLKSGAQRTGVNFGTTADVEKELGHTPPSLYLFRSGQEPWTESAPMAAGAQVGDLTIEKINPNVLGASVRAKRCFYFEFRSGDDIRVFSEYIDCW